MKILLVVSDLALGGAKQVVINLVNELIINLNFINL